jgi:hypothetical protein
MLTTPMLPMQVLSRLVGLDLDSDGDSEPAPPPVSASDSAASAGTAGKAGPNEDAWTYKDPQGDVQGPFTRADICDWYEGGYFPGALPIRPMGMTAAAFVPLATLLPLWAQGRSGLEAFQPSQQPPQSQQQQQAVAGGGGASAASASLLEQMMQSGAGAGGVRTLADIEAAAMRGMAAPAPVQQQQQPAPPAGMRTLADIEAAAMASAGGGAAAAANGSAFAAPFERWGSLETRPSFVILGPRLSSQASDRAHR